jgi:hypothetical protein
MKVLFSIRSLHSQQPEHSLINRRHESASHITESHLDRKRLTDSKNDNQRTKFEQIFLLKYLL